MSIAFQRPVVREFDHGLRQTEVGFLLDNEIVYNFVFSLELDLDALKLSSEASVLVFEIVCCHALLHDVLVKPLSFLMDNSRPHLAYL